MKINDLKIFLDEAVEKNNQKKFINTDPISIPHQFNKKQDIEISGFFAATFSWGNRTIIIKKSNELMQLMENSPHDFILNHSKNDLKQMENFVHRTFNSTDLLFFIESLKRLYHKHSTLEQVFLKNQNSENFDIEKGLKNFYKEFFDEEFVPQRTKKHVSTPERKSACKRLCMYLRWMVRNDKKVDFGIWQKIKPADLVCPLDVHVGKIARQLKLLHRPQNDWQSAIELTNQLKEMDKNDPVKYDFALFGIGILSKIK
jgi:uncharacterized protein (TIGR02757 family)